MKKENTNKKKKKPSAPEKGDALHGISIKRSEKEKKTYKVACQKKLRIRGNGKRRVNGIRQ